MRTTARVSIAALFALSSACGGGSPSGPAGIAYPTNPALYAVGVAVSPNLPTVTGSNLSWTVTPGLPPGLALHPTTGAVTGTPTSLQSSTAYTVTASNAGGSTTAVLSITVAAPPGAPTGVRAEAHVRAGPR